MKSKGGFIFLALLTFVFFLVVIPVIFNLHGGFFRAEFFITIILLILAIIFVFGLENPWKAMFIFFVFWAVNISAIYTRTWLLAPLAIPIILLIVGLYASAIKLKTEDEYDFSEPETTETPAVEEAETKKKTSGRKKK